MDLKLHLLQTHKLLAGEGIDHALIGGLALGAHGIQRFTNDIDFLVAGSDRQAAKLCFLKHGYHVFFESPEVLQLDGPGPVDFLFANRILSQQMILDAKELPGLPVKCVSVEGIIGLKIQAYINAPKREYQDKADILALISHHQDLNWDAIKRYADLFEQWPELERIRKLASK